MKNVKALIISLVISLGTGGLSALVSMNAMKEFENLNQPALSPPPIVFPIVWTVLFVLMGVAAYLVYVSDTPKRKKQEALAVYAVQLVVNFIWPILFFNLEAFFAAFLWTLVLLALIIITAVRFYMADKRAGFLFVPYVLWVAFAAYLSLAVFLLN